MLIALQGHFTIIRL